MGRSPMINNHNQKQAPKVRNKIINLINKVLCHSHLHITFSTKDRHPYIEKNISMDKNKR